MANSESECDNWDSTELKDETNSMLTLQDIKRLLITRGAPKPEIYALLKGRRPDNEKRLDLIKVLKNNYKPNVPSDLYLSGHPLRSELKLRGMDCKQLSNDHMPARLRNKLDHGIQWSKLVAIPREYGTDYHLIKMNQNQFCIVSIRRNKIEAISTYDPSQNEWQSYLINHSLNVNKLNFTIDKNSWWRHRMFDDWQTYAENMCVCPDPINKLIYIYYTYPKRKGILLIVNYLTKQIVKTIQGLRIIGNEARFIFINDKLHVITGELAQLIFNEKENKFEQYFDFTQLDTGQCFGFCKRRNNLLSICVNGIYSYNAAINKWTKLSMDIPNSKRLYSWRSYAKYTKCCVLTNDEKYMLLFSYGKIKVFDMRSMKCSSSRIVYPKTFDRAVITKDSVVESELITFGFVRTCWKECNIGSDTFPPQYIVKLMESWVIQESVYLSSYNHLSRSYHWKIDVGHIINNLK